MEIVKYILSCVIGCFDALVGNGMNGGVKEALVGLGSILAVIVIFFTTFSILDKTTKLKYNLNIFCSILITVLQVFIIFGILIVL